MDTLTIALGVTTLAGAVAGAIQWYKRNTVSSVSKTFKNENIQNKMDMKLKDIQNDLRALQEREIKNEQDIADLTKELYRLLGKIE